MMRLSRRRLFATALVLPTSLCGLAAFAQPADPAIEPVDAFYAALMDAMRHAREMKVQGRYARLEPTMMKSFDVPGMVRSAVGGAFNTLAAADQASLRIAFGKLLVATFASTFDDYKGEAFVVSPVVTDHGADKFVKSRFEGTGEAVPIDYLVRDTGKTGWRIVDVYLNGNISQLATWRALYGTLLQTGGAQSLLRAVEQQTAKFMAVI